MDSSRVAARVCVTNTGERAGREVVQCYAKFTDSRTSTPNCQLCAFESVFLEPGERKTVTLEIDRYWLKAVLPDGSRAEPDGGITLYFGAGQPAGDAEGLTL